MSLQGLHCHWLKITHTTVTHLCATLCYLGTGEAGPEPLQGHMPTITVSDGMFFCPESPLCSAALYPSSTPGHH